MKIPTTEEYISEINTIIKTQNRRLKKYLGEENDEKIKQLESPKYLEIINKFEKLKRYVSADIITALNGIKNNDRYVFNFVEGMLEQENRKYFKLIIKNNINDITNFIVLSYDTRSIFVEIKTANSIDDLDTNISVFPLEKFTKGKYRKMLFEYFLEIIQLDTLPKLKRKKEEKEDIEVSENESKITILNEEIEKMKKLAERNKSMMEEAMLRQEYWKQKKTEFANKETPTRKNNL